MGWSGFGQARTVEPGVVTAVSPLYFLHFYSFPGTGAMVVKRARLGQIKQARAEWSQNRIFLYCTPTHTRWSTLPVDKSYTAVPVCRPPIPLPCCGLGDDDRMADGDDDDIAL